MVAFLKSEGGTKEYQQILTSTLGKIPGSVFSLPHSQKDPGATHAGNSEVTLAQQHIQ